MDWIKCITNRLLRAARREAGITLIETMLAIVIFGIVSTSLIGVLTSATAADGRARQKSIALELAQQQVEYLRQLNYMNVGVSGGNPAGVVQETQSKWVAGLRYTLTTRIRFVTDPIAGAVVESANYKQIRVIVRRASDNMELARFTTYLSDSARLSSGSLNNSLINVTVQDYVTSELLGDVQVNLAKTWDPSFNAGDLTGNEPSTPSYGVATFEGLQETPTDPIGYYDVTASLAGYLTHRDSNPRLTLEKSDTNATVIKLYKPCTITVTVKYENGDLYTDGPAEVTIASIDSVLTETFLTDAATASVTVDTIDGEKIPPGQYTVDVETPDNRHGAVPAPGVAVPESYPDSPNKQVDVFVGDVVPEPATVRVEVRRGASSCTAPLGTRLGNAEVKIVWNTDPLDPTHNPQGSTTSDGDWAVFTSVPLDTYDIRASWRYRPCRWCSWVTLQNTLRDQQITGDADFCVPVS